MTITVLTWVAIVAGILGAGVVAFALLQPLFWMSVLPDTKRAPPLPPVKPPLVDDRTMVLGYRRCEYCGRFDDIEAAHRCEGCGAWIEPCQYIDVTRLCDEKRRFIRVPA